MPSRRDAEAEASPVFRHEAVFYGGTADFVAQLTPFLREGVRMDEPTLVVVDDRKIGLLRDALGADAAGVEFADMAHVGRNPARIIPAWTTFLDDHVDVPRPLRGVGEPIWPGRSPEGLVESELHEALLNVAFDGGRAWTLLCPYDTKTLGASVLEEAERNHPYLSEQAGGRPSTRYRSGGSIDVLSERPLPEWNGAAREMAFDAGDLEAMRRFVGADSDGFQADRLADLILAVNEVATNSVLYGGGGLLRIWRSGDSLVCEISDRGRIPDPLVGRRRPGMDQVSGYGLWIANHACDLVQVRTSPSGTVVRLHVSGGRR